MTATLVVSATEPAAPGRIEPANNEASIPELINRLGDEDFHTREAATSDLWRKGAKALPELKKASESTDPEVAMRAAELVRKIQLDVFPDSNPELIDLIQRYPDSLPADKGRILNRLKAMKAWRQILRLFAADEDLNVRRANAKSIHQIAMLAARIELRQGNDDAARELLELAPAEPENLLALAEFHRLHGTLGEELKRAQSRQGQSAAAWRLALNRASGDLEAAAADAAQAGMPKFAALYSTMLGDPVPWLKQFGQGDDEWNSDVQQAYAAIAIQRWHGDARSMQAGDLALIRRALLETSSRKQGSARSAVFLLGLHDLAESSLARYSTIEAFWHLYSMEKNEEALTLIHVDPQNPFRKEWVRERLAMLDKLAVDDDSNHGPADELTALAAFMELRGMHQEAYDLFAPPLLAMAEKDRGDFLDFIRNMALGANGGVPALQLSRAIGSEWAGNDKERWDAMMLNIFGDREIATTWWGWMPELMPEATFALRFESLLCLLTSSRDPKGLREQCLSKAWKLHDLAKDDDRKKILARIAEWAFVYGDAKQGVRAWDLMDQEARDTIYWGRQMTHLSAADRWDEVSKIILAQLDRAEESGSAAAVDLHAYAASTLRRAGKADAAKAHDEWVVKLALGDARACFSIGNGYAFGGDSERAAYWYQKALLGADPDHDQLDESATRWSDSLAKRQECWLQVAAMNELMCSFYNGMDHQWERPVVFMKHRLKADLYRALSLLKQDRRLAMIRLEQVHTNYVTDGSLADYFFPALLKLDMNEQYEAWFNRSWQAFDKVLESYPKSVNTRNTAAWLAARAQRNLPQAEKTIGDVLREHPNQAAYLDTMAEVQFAKGDRKKALEWSRRSLLAAPDDDDLRRQNHHFRNDPLPSRR